MYIQKYYTQKVQEIYTYTDNNVYKCPVKIIINVVPIFKLVSKRNWKFLQTSFNAEVEWALDDFI